MNVIRTNKMWGEINFKLGSEEICADEEEVKNTAGRTYREEGSKARPLGGIEKQNVAVAGGERVREGSGEEGPGATGRAPGRWAQGKREPEVLWP